MDDPGLRGARGAFGRQTAARQREEKATQAPVVFCCCGESGVGRKSRRSDALVLGSY